MELTYAEEELFRRSPPRGSSIKLMLCPLNFMGWSQISHTGLGISALNTARVLRTQGVNAIVRPVRNVLEIKALIGTERPTHIVINALWLTGEDLSGLVHHYHAIHFAVLVHSNIAFLQAEPNAITLLRKAVDLEQASVGNFSVAANSRNGVRGLAEAWEAPVTYLPNLYFLDDTVRQNRPKWSGGTLRIGAYGALRPLKNPTASAFAALAIATNLGTNLEFHISTGRNDGGLASNLIRAIEAIIGNLPYAKLVKDNWEPWCGFRRLVRHMHLMLQPSHTETFNIVGADSVAEGVPCVVSDVIPWAPAHWRANPDDTSDIARVGRTLLSDAHTGRDGVEALTLHNDDGIRQWIAWLARKIF